MRLLDSIKELVVIIYINNTSNNPYFNHALEEYFLNYTEEECFILWSNAPCILIGRNQNAYSEINIDYVKKHNIPVVRRASGGGAIFNDLGNFNFGFISNNRSNDAFADFKMFTTPIIEALKGLSINAELSGRNDLTIDGKKFSGNAQAKHKNRILHHGSLLFSASLEDLKSALNVRPIKFEGKAVKSVSDRVTNISTHLKTPMEASEFRSYLMDFVIKSSKHASLYTLTEENLKGINKVMEEKYSTWEWNFGKSPKYSFTNEKKFPGGIVEMNLNVEQGIIKDLRIYGDFFGREDISELEAHLIGTIHEESALRNKLSEIDLSRYMTNISVDHLIEVIFHIRDLQNNN